MKMRRLQVGTDRDLLVQAYGWEHENVPRWYEEMDAAFPVSLDEWLTHCADERQASVGVFEGERMVGLIYMTLVGKGVFGAHISAARNTSAEVLAEAIIQLRHQMFRDLSTQLVFGWIAKRNLGLWRLAMNCGFRPDGLVMLKGSYRKRVIEWVRVVFTREEWAYGL
jgi:RimJ/RimL family protein N-acetyltransferase